MDKTGSRPTPKVTFSLVCLFSAGRGRSSIAGGAYLRTTISVGLWLDREIRKVMGQRGSLVIAPQQLRLEVRGWWRGVVIMYYHSV